MDYLFTSLQRALLPAIQLFVCVTVITVIWHGIRNELTLKAAKFWKVAAFNFYWSFVLSLTVLSRPTYTKTLAKVWEGWYIYPLKNGDWNLDALYNIVMLLPYIWLMFVAFPGMLQKQNSGVTVLKIMWKAGIASWMFSVGIEVCQVIFARGTLQVADVIYNTLGGILGGILYWKLSLYQKN